MNKENKNTKINDKITPFPVVYEDSAETDEILREELKKEADELEEKLEKDPALAGVAVSDDLYGVIVDKLKAMGAWEEEGTAHTETELEMERGAEGELGNGREYERDRAESGASVACDGIGSESDVVCGDAEHGKGSGLDSAEPGGETVRGGVERGETLMCGKAAAAGDDDMIESGELEKLYQMLPEEDREAIALGRAYRKKQEKKERKRNCRRKILRRGSLVAAAVVVIFGAGMTSKANRKIVAQMWDAAMTVFGFRMTANYEAEEEIIRSTSKEELEAMADIWEKTGISAVDLAYLPVGIEYQQYDIGEGAHSATILYAYNDSLVYLNMFSKELESVNYLVSDDAVLWETVITDQKIEINIWETDIENQANRFLIEARYKECLYVIYGQISSEEAEKIARYIYFY